jgi:hypothetical protein
MPGLNLLIPQKISLTIINFLFLALQSLHDLFIIFTHQTNTPIQLILDLILLPSNFTAIIHTVITPIITPIIITTAHINKLRASIHESQRIIVLITITATLNQAFSPFILTF